MNSVAEADKPLRLLAPPCRVPQLERDPIRRRPNGQSDIAGDTAGG